MKNVKKFITSSYKKNGSFTYSPQNKINNLYVTCFGVMCLDLIGELDKFKYKNKLVAFIQKHQDKNTGYFLDKTVIPPKSSQHNSNYINLQLTDFAQMALSALNKKPLYEYKFLREYKEKNYLGNWLNNLNWENPWLVSNLIMFILNCFIYEDENENKKYINYILEWLDKNQNAKTGFWDLGKKSSLHNQMAGAYHFLIYYTFFNKKPRYKDKIIDSTLLIQNYDGLFSYSGGGGACDDLDAIDLLCRASFYANHRRTDVIKALTKSYNALWDNKNDNGGFCWAKRKNAFFKNLINSINIKLLFRANYYDFLSNFKSKILALSRAFFKENYYWTYSGIKNMKIRVSDSDMWSTWFRLLAIAIIEETFPEIFGNKKTFNWKMRKTPGLGFYKNGQH